MEQTPLEKLISELDNDYPVMGKSYLLEKVKSLLHYEKQYLRDVAEKAWDACQKWNDFIDDDGTLGEIIHNKMPFDREDFIKKQLKL